MLKNSNIVLNLATEFTELVSEHQKLGQTWKGRENVFIITEPDLELEIKNMPERQILIFASPLFDPIVIITSF